MISVAHASGGSGKVSVSKVTVINGCDVPGGIEKPELLSMTTTLAADRGERRERTAVATG